ncbi:MAG: hypothetical protein PHE67_13315 [Campylobacterales bacterium]|nr:hypothetical protein [Campylobacterales bacterium]
MKHLTTFMILGITFVLLHADETERLIDEKIKSITKEDGIVKITEYIGLLLENEKIINILPNTVIQEKDVTTINTYPSDKPCSWEDYWDCAETKKYIYIMQDGTESLAFQGGSYNISRMNDASLLLFHKFGSSHCGGLTVYKITQNSATRIADYFGEDIIHLVDVDHDEVNEVNLVSCGYGTGATVYRSWTSLIYAYQNSQFEFSPSLTREHEKDRLNLGNTQCDFNDRSLEAECQIVMNSIIVNTALNDFRTVKDIIDKNIKFQSSEKREAFINDYSQWFLIVKSWLTLSSQRLKKTYRQ